MGDTFQVAAGEWAGTWRFTYIEEEFGPGSLNGSGQLVFGAEVEEVGGGRRATGYFTTAIGR